MKSRFDDPLPEFQACFRPVILSFDIRPVENSRTYRTVIDYQVDLEALTERSARRRLELVEERGRSFVRHESKREVSRRIDEKMPALQALEAQRILLGAVLDDPDALSRGSPGSSRST